MISGPYGAAPHNTYGILSLIPLALIGGTAWWYGKGEKEDSDLPAPPKKPKKEDSDLPAPPKKPKNILVPMLLTMGAGLGLALTLWLLLRRRKGKKK